MNYNSHENVMNYFSGYFRDTMGSYDHLFHFLGALSILCALLWVFEPIYSRRKKKKSALRNALAC